MSASQIALCATLMVATGAIGAITGGNSLVNVPLMIMVGMSPRQAVATNMFAVTFMTVSATARFARARVLKGRLLLPLGALVPVTSAAGAAIAVKLPETVVPCWLPWSSSRNNRRTSSETLVDRLPGTWSKLEMNFLRHIVGWVRSRAGAMWKAVAPHDGPSGACGVAADIVRSRRELVIENAMLRHEVVILRRKSPHPLTGFASRGGRLTRSRIEQDDDAELREAGGGSGGSAAPGDDRPQRRPTRLLI